MKLKTWISRIWNAPDRKLQRTRRAAEKGNVAAQCALGRSYHHRLDVRQDYTEALRWYRYAAQQGNAEAFFSLGNCAYFGRGVARDQAEALRWYRNAAERGHQEAKAILAIWGE